MFGVCGVGRWTTEKPITPEEEKICHEMKPDIEEKVGDTFEAYIPLSYRSLIGFGTNLVKVYVGVGVCVHALIANAGPHGRGELIVTAVQHPKSASEPLIPFGD